MPSGRQENGRIFLNHRNNAVTGEINGLCVCLLGSRSPTVKLQKHGNKLNFVNNDRFTYM